MIRFVLSAGLAVFACYGQSFEVVSIKPADFGDGRARRIGPTGGPGTPNPGLFACENCSIANLVTIAYDLKSYQLPGAGSLNTDRYAVSAKVPPGTTKEDFRIMQRNLLAERFKLKIHREQKEMQVYELVVAKNGPKLKESVAESVEGALPPIPAGGPKVDRDGFPVLPPGVSGAIFERGRARWQTYNQGIEAVTNLLSNQLGRPVTDSTGLKGKYDFVLFWAMEGMMGRGGAPAPAPDGALPSAETGPTLFGAIQDQLGLRLEQKKGFVDIVVIDHVEKVPTEN